MYKLYKIGSSLILGSYPSVKDIVVVDSRECKKFCSITQDVVISSVSTPDLNGKWTVNKIEVIRDIPLSEKLKNRLMRDYEICVVTFPLWREEVKEYAARLHKCYPNATCQTEIVGESDSTELDVVVKSYKWVLENKYLFQPSKLEIKEDILVIKGTEGPTQDPYSYTEFSFTDDEEVITTLHLGLSEWLKIGDRTVEDGGDSRIIVKQFEDLVGNSIEDILQDYENNYVADPNGSPASYK